MQSIMTVRCPVVAAVVGRKKDCSSCNWGMLEAVGSRHCFVQLDIPRDGNL